MLQKAGDKRNGIFLIHRSAIIVVDTVGSHKKVLDAPLLIFCRSSRTDGNLAENLAGVGINNRNMKMLGHTEAEFCLAYARGAEYH